MNIYFWIFIIVIFCYYMRFHSPLIITYTLKSVRAHKPTKSYHKASCFDLYSIVNTAIPPHSWKSISTGVSIAPWPHIYIPFLNVTFTPFGNVASKIHTRSGVASKNGIRNHLGIIDNDYRDEITVIMYNHNKDTYFRVKEGDRVGQIEFYRVAPVWLVLVSKLTNSCRGKSGFGSSGR